MTEYRLGDHRWFTQLFEVRTNWVEAYFDEVFMGGLMRTTSRSEAENGVFGACINDNGSLLEFFTKFKSVIEMQWHKQARLIAECEGSLPSTKTPLKIEKHAAAMYTIAIFYDVQTKIYEGCFSCKIACKAKAQGTILYTIQKGQKKAYEVKYDKENLEVECSCGKFNRVGILCRHVFVVLKDNDAEMIPPKYILPRWTRNGRAHSTREKTTEQDAEYNKESEDNALAATVWKEFYTCMTLSKGKTTEMQEMFNFMQEQKGKLLKSMGKDLYKSTNSELLETFYGAEATTSITVKPPQLSKNKGSRKRMKSAREKSK